MPIISENGILEMENGGQIWDSSIDSTTLPSTISFFPDAHSKPMSIWDSVIYKNSKQTNEHHWLAIVNTQDN